MWLAADFIPELTFSQRLGFLETFDMAAVNYTACRDTIANSMYSLIYPLLKRSQAMRTLPMEIAAANEKGRLSKIQQYKETSHKELPYLAVCIK